MPTKEDMPSTDKCVCFCVCVCVCMRINVPDNRSENKFTVHLHVFCTVHVQLYQEHCRFSSTDIPLVFRTVRATNVAFIISCNELFHPLSIYFTVSRLFRLTVVLKFISQILLQLWEWMLTACLQTMSVWRDVSGFFRYKIIPCERICERPSCVCVCMRACMRVCVCVYQQQTCSLGHISHHVYSQPVLYV